MKRLTYKIAPEVVNYDAEDGTNFQDILNTLGAYEDTGLTPDEISALIVERDTLKKALKLACNAFDYTPSGNTLMDLYIQQAQEQEK